MKKRFLAIFIAILLLLSPTMVFANELDTNTTYIDPEDKITNGLKETMNNTANGSYISVYVWLNDEYGDELVYAHLSNKLGQEISESTEIAYINGRINQKVENYKENHLAPKRSTTLSSNDAVFETMSVEEKAFSLRNDANISNVISDEELVSCLNEGKSFEEIIGLSERYQYLSDYRDSRVAVNQSFNNRFYNKIDCGKLKNITVDSLLPYIEAECEKGYILTVAAMDEVKEIGYLTLVEEDVLEEATTSADETTDKYILAPLDTPYTGAGVKVGVLDVESYDPNASHLLNKNIVSMNSTNDDNSEFSHSTKVMSIIAGTSISLNNGNTYQGIAPNATIFFANELHIDMRELYWLVVEKNVAIINISQQLGDGAGYYNTYEQYLDCIVKQYKVVIVKSAGNDFDITSPGMGYNLITVGNVSNELDANGRLIINAQSSSYEEAPYLTNKPDLSAHGTNVYMVYNGQETCLGTGTSFAAPMVSGTVALMMEANPDLLLKPNTIKTLLMSTADQDKISSTNGNDIVSGNPTVERDGDVSLATGILREKSGSGLLNSLQAIDAAVRNDYHQYSFTISNSNVVTNRYYFEAGDKIEIAMVFDKASDIKIGNYANASSFNFDIQILSLSYDESNNLVQTLHFDSLSTQTQQLAPGYQGNYSPSEINNAELYEITFDQSGYYCFKIVQTSHGQIETISPNPFSQANHRAHNSTTVSLAISCGCSNKNITTTYASNTRMYSCSSCEVEYSEQISLYDIAKTITYGADTCGIVNFKLRFRAGYVDGVEAILLDEFEVVGSPNSQLGYQFSISPNGGDSYVTAMGYTETLTYEIMIIKNNNILSSVFYTSNRVCDYKFEKISTLTVY